MQKEIASSNRLQLAEVNTGDMMGKVGGNLWGPVESY